MISKEPTMIPRREIWRMILSLKSFKKKLVMDHCRTLEDRTGRKFFSRFSTVVDHSKNEIVERYFIEVFSDHLATILHAPDPFKPEVMKSNEFVLSIDAKRRIDEDEKTFSVKVCTHDAVDVRNLLFASKLQSRVDRGNAFAEEILDIIETQPIWLSSTNSVQGRAMRLLSSMQHVDSNLKVLRLPKNLEHILQYADKGIEIDYKMLNLK